MIKFFKLMFGLGFGFLLGGCVVMRGQENHAMPPSAPVVAIQPTVVVQEPNYVQPVYVQPNYVQPVYVQPVYVPPPVIYPYWRPCPPPCPPLRPFPGPHPYPQRGR